MSRPPGPASPAAPRHEQISTSLLGRIASGDWPAHTQLPSEHALCKQFGVSRVTVRRALATLEAEGRIYRRQGLGSFVAPPKTPQGLVRLTDFAQDMIRAGLNASSQVLHHAPEPAPADVAEALALPADPSGTPPYVVRLDRLRLASGEPLALDRTWLPPFYAQLLEGHDLARDTIYAVLERHYGIPVLSGRYTIEATLADETLAEALGLEVGRPLLRVVRVSRTAGERVVYVQHRYYRADRVAFELELAREPDQASEEGGMPLREFATVFHRV